MKFTLVILYEMNWVREFVNFWVFEQKFPMIRLLGTKVSWCLWFLASFSLRHGSGYNLLGHAVRQL
jgi:hypothetical protein